MSEPVDNRDLSAEAAVATAAPSAPAQARVIRNGDVLGIGWLHGALNAAVFRGKTTVGSWECPTPVRTLEDFESVLDGALTALKFAGTETFLVLEHDQFVHQTEAAPGFSDAAAKAYLKGWVERFQKEHGPMLWVSQPTLSVKQDRAFILHLLPRAFYDKLSQSLLARRLDLTRILPMTVPLHRELNRLPVNRDALVLMAVETGEATTVVVGRSGGLLLFSRTVLASMSHDPSRVGVEVNRSLLYVKQQFSSVVERIWLLGKGDHSTAEVRAKCGAGKQIMVLPSLSLDWLQTAHKLPANQPINLLAGYLRGKRRQQRLRQAFCAACWLGLGLLVFSSWTRSKQWETEQLRLAALRADEPALRAERDRLAQRNAAIEQERRLLHQVVDNRLPPVPAKFTGYLAGLLSKQTRLTEYSLKWDPSNSSWAFHLDGIIEGDDETARETVAALQKQLGKSPLRIRFNDSARAVIALPPSLSVAESQRFILEGRIETQPE
jgi:hypothetical protein